MSKNIIYKVDQVDTYTTAEFDKILSACVKIQMPKEYLISLYSRVVSNNKDSAEHISPFEGIKTKNVAIQFPKYNEVLSGIMNDLGKFTPLEFMKNYTAAEFGMHNCTAVENCFVFEKLLLMNRKAEHVILIDPTPFLVEKIAKFRDESFRCKIVLTFTNAEISKIYKKIFHDNVIQVLPIAKCSFVDESVSVVYFGHYFGYSNLDITDVTKNKGCKTKEARESYVCTKLAEINEALASAKKRQFLVLLPTSMIDPQRGHIGIRRFLFDCFTVQSIDLIDNKAIVTNGYKRLSLVKLGQRNKSRRAGALQSSDVVLREFRFVDNQMPPVSAESTPQDASNQKKRSNKEKNAPVHGRLEACEEYQVSAQQMYENVNTIISLCSDTAKEGHTSENRTSRNYKVSSEISVACSGKVKETGKIKPRIIYQGYVAHEKTQDYLGEKKLLHYEDRNITYSSLVDMYKHIEQLVLNDQALNAMIVESIQAKYKDQPISLKSFCIMYYDALRERKLDENTYSKVFSSLHSEKNSVCNLKLNVSTVEEVADAIKKTVHKLDMDEVEENKLILQMYMIYNVAIDKGFSKENPVFHAAKVLMNQEKQEKNIKNRMVEKILTDDQERDIFTYIFSDEPDPGLALGFAIKLTTGMTYAEVCALTRKDVYKLSHVDCLILNVDKRFGDKSTEPIPILDPIKIRQIFVSSFLAPRLSRWIGQPLKKLVETSMQDELETATTEDTVEEKFNCSSDLVDDLKLPIVYRMSEPGKPVTPDVLRRFGNEVFERFGPFSDIMRVADEKGGKKDISKTAYSGDRYRENFYDQGLSVAGFTRGELCYILGYNASETFDSSYAGFNKPSILVKMRDKVDVWISKRLAELDFLDESSKCFHFGEKKRKFVSKPTNVPMEIIIELEIEEDTPDILIELANQLGFSAILKYM